MRCEQIWRQTPKSLGGIPKHFKWDFGTSPHVVQTFLEAEREGFEPSIQLLTV